MKQAMSQSQLTPSGMAGYVSSLVVDPPRQSDFVFESSQKLTHSQQCVVQGALLSPWSVVEVQLRLGLDDVIGKCQLELSSCDVITVWASGCSGTRHWQYQVPHPATGEDHKLALDALRQLGKLPFIPARSLDGTVRLEASGIHPTIRSLCRDLISCERHVTF